MSSNQLLVFILDCHPLLRRVYLAAVYEVATFRQALLRMIVLRMYWPHDMIARQWMPPRV